MSIELKKVSYIYMPKSPFERQALRDVSLTIEEGSFIAIAGHTGSGKSTLVQHLNGLLQPSSGNVLIDGVDLADKSKTGRRLAQAARRKVGMVFQYPEQQLFEETVAADVAFGPRNQGLSEEELTQRVRESLELVGLDYEACKDCSPYQLSGGQKRRVAIAGVLALRPKYLVLDEPTAGLDPKGREELLHTICRLHEEWNLSIVFISHSMEDIARFAKFVAIMKQGSMVLYDTPQRAFQQTELLRDAGLKPPHITMLLHKIRQAGIDVDDTVIEAAEGIRKLKEAMKHVK